MTTQAGSRSSRHPRDSGRAARLSRRSADRVPIAAVVLAGGTGTRLGGADKPALTIAGRSLLAIAVSAAVNAGARRVVVVGPPRPGLMSELRVEPRQPGAAEAHGAPAGLAVEFTAEQPPGAGPVPALRAGLELVREPWLVLLAADLPFLRGGHVSALLAAARQAPAGAGAIFEDDQGHPQWLAGCWQTAALQAALARYEGSSVGGLLGPLRALRVTADAAAAAGAPGGPPPWLDCDTSDDLASALALAARDEPTGE